MAELIPPRRDEPWFDANGNPTLRVSEFLESLSNSANSTAGSAPSEAVISKTFALQSQVGSGDPLTSDETGFTVDSDRLSVDQTEA